MHSFDQALQVIAGIMRDGVAKHPDNEWVQRSVEYHVGRADMPNTVDRRLLKAL